MSQKRVAIVVPLSNRTTLTGDEKISLRHLEHFLGKYDKFFIAPNSLDFQRPGFKCIHVDDKFFGSAAAHKKLLFSILFYKMFIEYEYLFLYHLDALVFSDQVDKWCDRGYDFIGPPWIKHPEAPYYGNAVYEGKVGNGGFSLRKIETFLRILSSKKPAYSPSEYWDKFHSHKPLLKRIINSPKRVLMNFKKFNCIRWELERYAGSEERFLIHRARHYYSNFNIAPIDEALYFGFECVPRYCYELTNNKLPFGCHAWHVYDRKFWEPFLLA